MADPSARITRVDVLVASPGHCAICGKSSHPAGFAATDNFDFEFYGTVYFCEECVGEYARLFGYLSPKEMEDLKDTVAIQAKELVILRQAIIQLENAVDGYASLNTLRSSLTDLYGSDSSGSAPESPDSSEDVAELNSDGEGHQLSIDELGDEQGRDDVRDVTSTDSIDELLPL